MSCCTNGRDKCEPIIADHGCIFATEGATTSHGAHFMLSNWRNLQIYHDGRFAIEATTSKDIVPKHCTSCCTIGKQIESTIMVDFQQKRPLAYES